jgi:hypothetical protein
MTASPVPFRQHMDSLRWAQGDHVIVAAPTKCGKSTLVSRLVEKRSHVVTLVAKLRDDTFGREYKGWARYEEWPRNGFPSWEKRILLWPKPEKTLSATRAKHHYIFRNALDRLQTEGNRCCVIDEGLYVCDSGLLNMGKEVGMLFFFGRSAGITMVLNTQRPAWLPKVVYSSSTHAYIARTTDREDLKRLSDFGGINAREAAEDVRTLPTRHDFLYLNPQGSSRSVIVNTRR